MFYNNSPTDILAKQTRYKQTYFRSRIEARWAVFFDALGIKWFYEPEKFNLDGIVYIPDFWISGVTGMLNCDTVKTDGVFIEVKGAPPTQLEIDKAYSLMFGVLREVYLVFGDGFSNAHATYDQATKPPSKRFSQCPFCGEFGFDDNPNENCGSITPFSHFCMQGNEFCKNLNLINYFYECVVGQETSPMIKMAREAARSARFESNEWLNELDGIILAIKRMKECGVFCSPYHMQYIINEGHRVSNEKWMSYSEPWLVEHKRNLDAKVDCECAHCYNVKIGVQ